MKEKMLVGLMTCAFMLCVGGDTSASEPSDGSGVLPAVAAESETTDRAEISGPVNDCAWLGEHGWPELYWEVPFLHDDGRTREYFFFRFQVTTPCSLAALRFQVFRPATVGNPTVRIQIFGSAYSGTDSLKYPSDPDNPYGGPNHLAFLDVPYDELLFWPEYNVLDLRALGPFPIDWNEVFFVTIGLPPNAPGDQILALITDRSYHSTNLYASQTGWFMRGSTSSEFRYMGEVQTPWHEMTTTALVCAGQACFCTKPPADFDGDAFLTVVDLNGLIDVLYFGGQAEMEQFCRLHPADFDADGYFNDIDLNLMIEHLFFSGPGPGSVPLCDGL